MGKTSKRLFTTMYGNNILDLATVEDLEEVSPLKSNKAIKSALKKTTNQKQKQAKIKDTISAKPVDANCNKCNGKVIGGLINDIYLPTINKLIPVILYICKTCGHSGRRSVQSLALPIDAYNKKYFN